MEAATEASSINGGKSRNIEKRDPTNEVIEPDAMIMTTYARLITTAAARL